MSSASPRRRKAGATGSTAERASGAKPKRRRVDQVQAAPKVDHIAELEERALSDPKNANDIIELLELCDVSNREAADGETDEEGLKAIYALHAVFLAHRGFDMPPKAAKKHRTGLVGVGVDDDEDEVASASAPNAKTKYRHWIHEQYLDYVAVLLDVLSTNEPELYAVPCLKILMDLLANSAAVPVPKWKFPSSLLQRILTAIVAGEAEKPELFECFLGGYVQFDDVRRHTYKVLASICTQAAASSSPDDQRTLAYNVYNILQSFEGCSPPAEEGKPALFAAPSEGDLAPTHALGKAATYKRSYSQCWLAFLKLQLPSEIFKNVLLRMCEDIMPYMYDPKLLIDFLRDSYDLGGVVSILALEGVFTLMQEHNLDYPLFYGKLYALFEPSIFHVKYRSRFFRLADKFLRSTYIPGYLVAAFAKRLSRLALTAPPAGCMVAIRFVYNLLKRHPTCKVLIHREWDETTPAVRADPFDPNEADPAKCHAFESSLWETQALLHHYYPDVAKLPAVLSTPALRKGEMDMRRAAQRTYVSLYTAERSWVYLPPDEDEDKGDADVDDNLVIDKPRGLKERAAKAAAAATPLAFVRPDTLISGTSMFDQWELA